MSLTLNVLPMWLARLWEPLNLLPMSAGLEYCLFPLTSSTQLQSPGTDLLYTISHADFFRVALSPGQEVRTNVCYHMFGTWLESEAASEPLAVPCDEAVKWLSSPSTSV